MECFIDFWFNELVKKPQRLGVFNKKFAEYSENKSLITLTSKIFLILPDTWEIYQFFKNNYQSQPSLSKATCQAFLSSPIFLLLKTPKCSFNLSRSIVRG
jgi:hypothetical protein